jgi:predicted AAA+ superfamily ATPase
MIKRELSIELVKVLKEYPVVTILGPRQSGKTTLARETLPDYLYCNLESPENREYARQDPKTFLKQFKGPVILDEIQRVPELLSYIQVIVDEKKVNGQFVLTGSHQLILRESITQSLAGRTSILELLPFSISELKEAGIEFDTFEEYILNGFLPRIYDQNQRPTPAYSNYFQTYVERDVRLLINLKDVTLFEKFIRLLAGRVGQIFDYSSIAGDVGVDAKTIKNWLSILEASYIIYKLNPYFENFGKRVIKSPKYYFFDVGLLAFVLGIEDLRHIKRDPLIGSIFENLVVIEALKNRLNKGKISNLYFYRDEKKNEIDLLAVQGREITSVEIKSSSTYSTSLTEGLLKFKKNNPQVVQSILIYSGDEKLVGENLLAINFRHTSNYLS